MLSLKVVKSGLIASISAAIDITASRFMACPRIPALKGTRKRFGGWPPNHYGL
jgi:hypothetical protein